MTDLKMSLCAVISVRVSAALVLTLAIAAPWSDTRADTAPAYGIDFYTISAGGSSLHNSCYALSGTVGQAAPGYSSESIYSLIAGYWQPASVNVSDEIFFNGFEGC